MGEGASRVREIPRRRRVAEMANAGRRCGNSCDAYEEEGDCGAFGAEGGDGRHMTSSRSCRHASSSGQSRRHCGEGGRIARQAVAVPWGRN